MVRSRSEALAAARASVSYTSRMCMQWTRLQFGKSAVGDFDGDGAADAEDGWKASTHRHPGDKNPPAGVPVYWGGGSEDNGHVNVSLGPDNNGVYWVRGTDSPRKGLIGSVPLEWVEKNWGMPYLGWTEDILGELIEDDITPKPVVEKTRGEFVDKALKKLDKADGSGPRMKKIRAAIKSLKSIKPFKKR